MDTALLVDIPEAARRLSVGRTTIYELIGSGRLEAVKVGRLRRVPVDALARYVDAQRQAGQAVSIIDPTRAVVARGGRGIVARSSRGVASPR
jgi:excisionase family DNA binding protein